MQLSPTGYRAGSAGDKQTRHWRQIGDDRVARDILAQHERQRNRRSSNVCVRSAHATDRLTPRIGQFDADHRAPADRRERTEMADMLRAISSASWMTRLALMPDAGSSNSHRHPPGLAGC